MKLIRQLIRTGRSSVITSSLSARISPGPINLKSARCGAGTQLMLMWMRRREAKADEGKKANNEHQQREMVGVGREDCRASGNV